MTCPSCGGELTKLCTSTGCDTLSRILECRRCRFPDNRWLLLMGSAVRLSDQPDLLRGMIDL